MTATMKLSTRLTTQTDRIRTMIGAFANNVDVELQQRSAEYTCIFNTFNHIRNALLEPMPVAETRKSAQIQNVAAAAGGDLLDTGAQPVAPAVPQSDGNNLLDLLGDDLGAPSQPAAPAGGSSGGGDMLDLLGGLDLGGGSSSSTAPPMSAPSSDPMNLMDLLGGGPSSSAPSTSGHQDLLGHFNTPSQPPASNSGTSSLLDLFGSSPAPAPAPASNNSVTAFSQNGINIRFDLSKSAPSNNNNNNDNDNDKMIKEEERRRKKGK